MTGFSSDGVSAAFNHESAASNIDRFNKPLHTTGQTTFGFKGFPDNNMLQPKQPLRHQPSADLTSDVNRYFRKDSPPEWHPPPNQPPPRMPSPPPQPQKEPDWLQEKRNTPPQEALHQTISPRYKDEPQSYRKHPIIRDPHGELTSADKRKKLDEIYIAEEDLAMARQRKEREKLDKIKEQQKMKYADEDRGMDYMRNSMPERREEMLHDQAKQMRHLEHEIERLRAQDDMAYRRDDRPMYDNPRAQSDIGPSSIAHTPLYVFTAKRNMLHKMNFVGMLFPKEPQTDRAGYRRHNRDNEIFGQSVQKVPEYLNVSPRRHPVGKLYNKDSTYTTDFDVPFGKHGSRNLGNPNKDPMEPFNPFGLEGGGAPMVDASGQRKTRIAGSMGVLGRELSYSARARKAHKRDLLHELGEQAAGEKARKEREKAYYRQGYVELADSIRQKDVGYPRYKQNGLISQHHHLPHMFETTPYAERTEQKKYHDFLERQIEDRDALNNLGKFEEKRQAKEHFRTLDSFFGRRGGGNIKGPDPRKINLDRAIHNPQSTNSYMGRAPYAAEF